MAECGLAGKMKLKAATRAVVVNAPAGYLETLGPLPAGVELSGRLQGSFGWIHAFVRTSAELNGLAAGLVKALAADGLLWVSFPKGTSGIQADLTRDKGWDALADADLRRITLIAVDGEWSAFGLRRYRPGEARQPAWR